MTSTRDGHNPAGRSAQHSEQQIPLNHRQFWGEESPSERHEGGRRVSVIPLGDAANSRAPFAHLRSSVSSTSNSKRISGNPYRKYSLSSYEHPYDIPPPERIHPSTITSANTRPSGLRKSVGFSDTGHTQESLNGDNGGGQTQKREGILANMMQWYSMGNSGTHQIPSQYQPELMGRQASTFSENDYGYSSAVNGMRRGDSTFSMMSFGSDVLDPDDPRLTGVKATQLDDQEDLEKNALRQMDYRARRKHIQRIRIEFNVSCELCYPSHHIIF